MTIEIALVIVAYLVGSLPTALFVVRWSTGRDVRRDGSRNVGAANALRLAGWRAGAVVSLVDVAKGMIPVYIMGVFNPASRWLAAAMLATVLGHCFPVWLKFKGGKGVATGFGAFLVISPLPALWALLVWVVVLAATRWVALASMIATAFFPVILFFSGQQPTVIVISVTAAAALIILRHSSNIRNLLAGSEPRIGKDGSESGGES